jgi:hypothetical protein
MLQLVEASSMMALQCKQQTQQVLRLLLLLLVQQPHLLS